MGFFSPGEVTLSLKVPSKQSGERPFGISHSFPYSCMWRAWLPGNQVSGSLCACIRLGNGAVLKLSVAETYTEMSLGLENYFLKFHSKTTSFPIFLIEGRGDRRTLFSSVDGYISTEANIQTLISKSEVIYISKGELMSVAAAFCLLLSDSLISFFPHSFTFTISPFLLFRVFFSVLILCLSCPFFVCSDMHCVTCSLQLAAHVLQEWAWSEPSFSYKGLTAISVSPLN